MGQLNFERDWGWGSTYTNSDSYIRQKQHFPHFKMHVFISVITGVAMLLPLTNGLAPLHGMDDNKRNMAATADTGREISFPDGTSVDACPVVTAVPVTIAHRFNIDTTYYTKYLEAAGGIPVVSSSQVSDAALLQVGSLCVMTSY